VRRPIRPVGSTRIPPASTTRRDPLRTSTTGGRSGSGPRPDASGRSSHGLGGGRSHGEAGATLGPTGLEDGATAAGAHASAEPVRLGTVPVVGLERTLHGISD
jgi:hypothetical protein